MLTALSQNQCVSLIVFVKLSVLVLTVVDLLAKVNTFLSLILMYSPVCEVYWWYWLSGVSAMF